MAGTSDGLAVGLAVGVPSFLVLILVILFYIRFRRNQKREDNNDIIDLELRDNQSFEQFGEELHKQRYYPKVNSDLSGPSSSSTDVNGSNNLSKDIDDDHDGARMSGTPGTSGSPGTTTPPKRLSTSETPGTPGTFGTFAGTGTGTRGGPDGHSKTNSSYDFYETFIPTFPDFQPPPPPSGGSKPSSSQNSSTSNFNVLHLGNHTTTNTNGSPGNKSLDNLAKQLNNQPFFEKLPSRSTTVYIPKRSSAHNSVTEVDVLVQDAINDNYVYDKKLEVYPENPDLSRGSHGKSHDNHLDGDDNGEVKLSHILGGNIDNSFKNDNDMDVVFK